MNAVELPEQTRYREIKTSWNALGANMLINDYIEWGIRQLAQIKDIQTPYVSSDEYASDTEQAHEQKDSDSKTKHSSKKYQKKGTWDSILDEEKWPTTQKFFQNENEKWTEANTQNLTEIKKVVKKWDGTEPVEFNKMRRLEIPAMYLYHKEKKEYVCIPVRGRGTTDAFAQHYNLSNTQVRTMSNTFFNGKIGSISHGFTLIDFFDKPDIKVQTPNEVGTEGNGYHTIAQKDAKDYFDKNFKDRKDISVSLASYQNLMSENIDHVGNLTRLSKGPHDQKVRISENKINKNIQKNVLTNRIIIWELQNGT